MKSLHKCMR
uniref:Uncharacterized protein n=1 Tax=Anguilla anguilla TaxID=7936 RepID=A0A0E9XXA5_ANGAN